MGNYNWISFPLVLLGLAFIVHGFPSLITINKKNVYYNYPKPQEEDD
jgi:hypothetical protein